MEGQGKLAPSADRRTDHAREGNQARGQRPDGGQREEDERVARGDLVAQAGDADRPDARDDRKHDE